MRVAILQTPATPLNVEVHGGLERVALYELDLLSKNGHDVKLYVSKLIGRSANVFKIRDLGWQNRVLKFYYYINFGLRNCKADIFHGHYTPILALMYPQKSIVHFHGLSISELILYRYRFFTKRYHKANYIFCAECVKEEFQKMYPDIPESQLHVVYNGVDVDNIRPPNNKHIGNVVNICFYARWIQEKGIYDVLRAAEILESKGRTDFKIWYGGWSNSKEVDLKVREWAGRLKSIELVGEIKRSELPIFLKKMDIGLVPSTYNDPFPLVPLEMMSAGLPVIAYSAGGLKESIIDANTGFLVENQPKKLAEKIEYYLDNRKEIEKMGKAAREYVEKNLTWEKHMNKLLDIYNLIVNK